VLLPSTLTGVVFGLVAGMMVFVAIDELLPAARRYQTDMHQVVYGLVAGMVVMAVSLLLL
jgi:ZIP family zinc transporter